MSENIIRVLFNVLCEQGDDEATAALGFLGGDDAEGGSPVHAAAQSLDSCALHLPPEKILSVILTLVESAFASQQTLQVPNILQRIGIYSLLSLHPASLAGPTHLLLCFMIGQIEKLHSTWSR